MNLKYFGQLAGAVALTVGLAGCMDVTMDVAIQSETTGKATTTMTMGADFYAMAKAGMASENAEGGFCEEEGAVLTENPDGSATCTMVSEGTFDQLKTGGEGDDGAKFEVVGPGLVKATFSTAEMSGEVGGGEEQDEETKAMMQAFFEGHFVTLKVSGNEIVETNMTIADDKKSAEQKMPFLELINNTANLPAELYAIVKTN
jgi:hypothetical protein